MTGIGAHRLRSIPSDVVIGDRRYPDHNGFVTALAVRALRQAGKPIPDAWLDVLESCRHGNGGFGFWPVGARPAWAPDLPGDADDTAVMTLELLNAGRLLPDEGVRIALRTLARHRVTHLQEPGPPWRRRGVFGTWHRRAGGTDLIDCTVNANALALFARLGLLHLSGVAQSIEMLAAAVRWAGERPLHASSLSPFYPEPNEFVRALAHAVAAGVADLTGTYQAAATAAWASATPDAERYAICSSPYGAVKWFSPELVWLRDSVRCQDCDGTRSRADASRSLRRW